MPRQVASIALEMPLTDDDSWVVLIGEGSSSRKTLDFLRDLWPDIECRGAAVRTAPWHQMPSRSETLDPMALRGSVEGDA